MLMQKGIREKRVKINSTWQFQKETVHFFEGGVKIMN